MELAGQAGPWLPGQFPVWVPVEPPAAEGIPLARSAELEHVGQKVLAIREVMPALTARLPDRLARALSAR